MNLIKIDRETWTKNVSDAMFFVAKNRKLRLMMKQNKPEWHDDPCGRRGRESREGHSYSPSNTCCIHSCENRHVTCIEQRSSLSAEASTMVATCCHHHQVLQHPINYSIQKQNKLNQTQKPEHIH